MAKLEIQILQLIRETYGHMTADEVLAACSAAGIKASQASVYRVLSKLVEEGMVRRLRLHGEPDRYDKTIIDHEHLVCISCGSVSDLHIDKMKAFLEEKSGVEIGSFDLNIHYVCPQCKDEEKKTNH